MIKTILPNNTFDLVLSFDLPDYCQNPTGPLSLLHPHYIFCIVRLVWFKSMQKLDMPTVILCFFLFRNKCQWFDSFQPLDIFFNNTWFTASQTSSQEHNQTSTSCKHVHSFDMTGLAIHGKPVVRYGCFNSEMVRLFLFWINPNTTKYKTCNVICFPDSLCTHTWCVMVSRFHSCSLFHLFCSALPLFAFFLYPALDFKYAGILPEDHVR